MSVRVSILSLAIAEYLVHILILQTRYKLQTNKLKSEIRSTSEKLDNLAIPEEKSLKHTLNFY